MPNRAQLPPPPGAAAPGVSNSDPTRCRRARSTSLDPRKAMGHVPAHKYEPKPTTQTLRIAGDGRVCARALPTLRGARRQAGRPSSSFSFLHNFGMIHCGMLSLLHPLYQVFHCTLRPRVLHYPAVSRYCYSLYCAAGPEASESRPWAAAALHPHDRPAR